MTLRQLDHYQILGRLGEGFIYKGQDSRTGDLVAIKVLPAFMRSDVGLRARFEREVKVEQSIEHPNLARFHEVAETAVNDPELVGSAGDTAGRAQVLYLVHEYVEGANLATLMEGGQLPIREAIQTVIQVTDALSTVHQAGLVHRNVNPENIRITPAGVVKLLDFGLVKVLKEEVTAQDYKTSAGQLLGTAPYLAPEQVRGEEVDARTDLFAVGVLLYQMISGQPPFPHTNLLGYFHAILEENPTPLTQLRSEASAELESLVRRLLSKAPSDRYQSAVDLGQDLSALVPR